MGANASSTVSKITNSISNEIDQSAGASATAECKIKTGDIILKNSKQCTVTNKNACGAKASAVIDATVNAAATAYSEATTDQKTGILPGINSSSTDTDIKNAIRNVLIQKCQSDTSLTNEIIAGNLVLDGCEGSAIQNINSGDAEAQCGIKTLLQSVVDTTAKASTTQATGQLFDLGGNSTYIIASSVSSSSSVCCIICLVVIGFLAFQMSKKSK